MIVDLWSASTKLSRNRLVGTLSWRSAFDGSQLPTTRTSGPHLQGRVRDLIYGLSVARPRCVELKLVQTLSVSSVGRL
jgi:hypothetical protein